MVKRYAARYPLAMTRGKFWFRVSILAAMASGLLGEWAARHLDLLPAGWGWSLLAYTIAAVLGFLLVGLVLTLSGR